MQIAPKVHLFSLLFYKIDKPAPFVILYSDPLERGEGMSLYSCSNNNQNNDVFDMRDNDSDLDNSNSSSSRCLNQIIRSLDNLNNCDLRKLDRCIDKILNCR